MKGAASGLDRALEALLTLGVLLSGACLALGLWQGNPVLLKWGLLLLMWTPVARVVMVTAALVWERDWAFAAISLWILGVLAGSLHVAGFL